LFSIPDLLRGRDKQVAPSTPLFQAPGVPEKLFYMSIRSELAEMRISILEKTEVGAFKKFQQLLFSCVISWHTTV
jgi:hypothetical protein